MWLDNLKALKDKTKKTAVMIAKETGLPERTVTRILSGATENPTIDTLHRIVVCLGGSLDDILADTKTVVATEKLVEVKETANVLEAQLDLITAENEMLKTKVSALTAENDLLKKDNQHKDELLALHKYYQAHIEQLVNLNTRW